MDWVSALVRWVGSGSGAGVLSAGGLDAAMEEELGTPFLDRPRGLGWGFRWAPFPGRIVSTLFGYTRGGVGRSMSCVIGPQSARSHFSSQKADREGGGGNYFVLGFSSAALSLLTGLGFCVMPLYQANPKDTHFCMTFSSVFKHSGHTYSSNTNIWGTKMHVTKSSSKTIWIQELAIWQNFSLLIYDFESSQVM